MIEEDGYEDEVSEDEDEDSDDIAEPSDDDDFSGDDVFGDDDDEDATITEAAPARPRRRAGVRGPSVAGIPKAKLEKAEHAAEAWQKLDTEFLDQPAIDYTVKVNLNRNDVILHRKFGRGFVIDTAGPQKVEVLFQDGLRKLVHGR